MNAAATDVWLACFFFFVFPSFSPTLLVGFLNVATLPCSKCFVVTMMMMMMMLLSLYDDAYFTAMTLVMSCLALSHFLLSQ